MLIGILQLSLDTAVNGGIGEYNNNAGDSVLSNQVYSLGAAGATYTQPLINGFNGGWAGSTFGNRGHLNRMLRTNIGLSNGSTATTNSNS